MVGLASFPWGGDWTPIWLKELQIAGSYVYGLEEWRGRRVRTMEIVLDWMAKERCEPRLVSDAPVSVERLPRSTEHGDGEGADVRVQGGVSSRLIFLSSSVLSAYLLFD